MSILPFTPSANASWFKFTIGTSLSLPVYAFSGQEKVNEPYEFVIELVSPDAALDIGNFMGQKACLIIADKSRARRPVHGVIRKMEQLHTANSFTHYRAILVPRLWFLQQTTDHRIFQNLNILDIIKEVLEGQRFTGDSFAFKCSKTYEPREYCVQYGESDLYFLQRLCEEEGVYFYFEHEADKHILCFSDAAGGAPIPGEAALRFFQGSGQPADTAVISRLTYHQQVNSDAATFREWNFETPKLDLQVFKQEGDWEKAPVPVAMELETYQYPHLYQDKGEGERYVDIQLLRQLTWHLWIEGQSDVSRLMPGFVMTPFGHPRPDINAGWWLTSVKHWGEQPQVLGDEAPERGMQYHSSFVAIPEKTRFVPQIAHPKKRIFGSQTAIVTGPSGEEIYPDKYGRVKVQFFWDRADQWNEKTTCWIRVSQGWAGGQYGTIAIPRIGHEVIVSFLEGDPDRPLATGRTYHALNMPPYELPDHKTRTVFKSLSSPGGGGFNELRIEDKKGVEEIYVHAEKDLHTHTKNNWRDSIGNDTHKTVGNNTYLTVSGEVHEIFEGVHKSRHDADVHQTISGDSHFSYSGKWLGNVGDEIHLKSGITGVIECGTELTLKAGNGFIKLDPSGVTIVGAGVKINSGGSPGNGTGASLLLPDASREVGASKTPVYAPVYYSIEQVEVLEKAAKNHAMFADACPVGDSL